MKKICICLMFIFLFISPIILSACNKKDSAPQWREAYAINFSREGPFIYEDGSSDGGYVNGPVYINVMSDKEIEQYINNNPDKDVKKGIMKIFVLKEKHIVKYYTVNFYGEKSKVVVLDRDQIRFIDWLEDYE